MDSILETFQIDWRLMVAQIVNFLIVLAVLWWLAAKPLMKLMRERTAKIETSLKDAERIGVELKATEEKKATEIKQAKQEAQAIIDRAQKVAEQQKGEILITAKTEVEKVKIQAKQEIQGAKEKMLADAQTELGDLVIAAVKKIVQKDLSADDHKVLVAKTIKEVEASETK